MSKVIIGDCLEEMKKMPNQCIDIIITSPPYNLGNTHHTGNKHHKAYDDDLPESEYQAKQINVLNECHRILKEGGSMWYNHKNRIRDGSQISPYEWLFKTNFVIKQEIVWINRSQNFDKIRFYPFTERLYWLTKSPKTKMQNLISHSDVFDRTEWKAMGTKGKFTRAFPEKMIEDILTCFPESKTVLDPFAGSGTVGAVCKKLNKTYILIEIEKKYNDVILERLK